MSEDPRTRTSAKTIGRAARLWVIALFVLLFGSAPAVAEQKPDFSAITSRAKAEALVREARLVRILFFPASLGGEEVRENIGYVPSAAAEALGLAEGTIERFARDGLIDKLDVVPDYRGDSIIPTCIRFHATKAGADGGFHPTVDIW